MAALPTDAHALLVNMSQEREVQTPISHFVHLVPHILLFKTFIVENKKPDI